MCHGTGWEFFRPDDLYLERVYGTNTAACGDFAKRCTRCKGYKPNEDTTGCPENMRHAAINKFRFDEYREAIPGIEKVARNFIDEFENWKFQGKSLYLWSNTSGSGKTFLACCIGKSIMMKYNARFKFLTVPQYIDKAAEKISIQKNGGFEDPTAVYRECDLLVLDDIGSQIDKPWQNQELFKLINERLTNGLLTIYTSNMTIDKLNVDERIKNRIYGTTIVLHMPEESMRVKYHEKSQDDFLRRVLNG